MKIVILDGYTVNPGDLSFSAFEKLGKLSVYESTAKDEILSRAKNADIVITNKTPLTKEIIGELKNLKYIGLFSTGADIVDNVAANERKIPIANVPAYSTMSVAQHVFALLFELTNHVAVHSKSVHSGEWEKSEHFCYWSKPLLELNGLKMGLFGFGNIARRTAKIAESLGMEIIVHTRTDRKNEFPNYTFTDIETLFKEADVLSLHTPLTNETKSLLGEHLLSLMKKSAFLINTSRGAVINENALAKALNEEKIKGAGLDVLSEEPPKNTNPLLSAKNCVITPHIAWATRAARSRVIEIAASNVEAFIEGRSQNVVNTFHKD